MRTALAIVNAHVVPIEGDPFDGTVVVADGLIEEGLVKAPDVALGGAISGANTRPAPSGNTLRWTARNSASIRRSRASVVSCACAGAGSSTPPASTEVASVPATIALPTDRRHCRADAPKISIVPDPVRLSIAVPALISIRASRHHGKP